MEVTVQNNSFANTRKNACHMQQVDNVQAGGTTSKCQCHRLIVVFIIFMMQNDFSSMLLPLSFLGAMVKQIRLEQLCAW